MKLMICWRVTPLGRGFTNADTEEDDDGNR